MNIINVISNKNVPKWGNTKQYIAVHYLGVVGQNNKVESGGYGAHYYIYWDGTIYQAASHDAILWQVGTGGYYTQKHPSARNSNTIGIEMCPKCDGNSSRADDPKWYFTTETQEACVWLVQKLMKDLGLPASHVLRHYDIVNKHCLPLDTTELLTPEGWKELYEIHPGDIVAQYIPEIDGIEFANVIDTVEPYDSDVLKCHGLEATPDHRMWCKPIGKNSKDFRVRSWGEMLEGKKLNIVKTNGFYDSPGLDLSDEELRFLVWVQGDGHYMRYHKGEEPCGIEFHFRKQRKIDAVHNLLTDMGISYRDSYKSDGTVSIRIYDRSLYQWCEQWLHKKCFTYQFIDMSQSQFNIFWKELLQCDGCAQANLYSSNVSINLDVVQAICATHGVRTNICSIGQDIKNALVRSDTNYSIGTRYTGVEKRNTAVSCVTVPSGFILIRQNGRTFIVGNCPAPYVNNNHYKTSWTWDEFKARISGSSTGGSSGGGSSTSTDKVYRIRKSWGDAASQIGAYSNLDNAKAACKSGYTVYDWNGKAVYSNGGNSSTPHLYRIRKSWADAKSQIGAYEDLTNAKNACKTGYTVYDENGKAVYSKSSSSSSNSGASAGNSNKELIKAGQIHANNFCGAGLQADGVRGSATKKAGIKVLQNALNLDYGAGLSVDGVIGSKTKAALKGHTVKKGETQYMVTALEILLMLREYNPNGVESPGSFGDGCLAAVKAYQQAAGLSVDGIAGYNTFMSLVS